MYPPGTVKHAGDRRILLAGALLAVLAGAAARRFRRIEVTGGSMLPTLEPGDRVVVVRARRPRTGDVVACADPGHPTRTVVKRVAAVPGGYIRLHDGRELAAGAGYIVLGDNFDVSVDSRHFGPISVDLIIGRLIFRYLPEPRTGFMFRRSARFAFESEGKRALSVENDHE
ncbi:MAG: signal peptidase I [Acidimicrobiia bacterium]